MSEEQGSAGARLRAALAAERPLQVVGTINAYCALLAERAGFRAIYLSGAGTANAAFGLPDLGMTTLGDVAEEVRRITAACPLPLLVDADTGFGPLPMMRRTVGELERAGAAGIHIEDQVESKRCGHRPGKVLVSSEEMVARIRAAVAARHDPAFVIMARTDAYAVEGLEAAIERARACVAAGADMIFAEALPDLEAFRTFCAAVEVPVLANLTEFGRTPLLGLEELGAAGVALALYPVSAFRMMSAAALRLYRTLREEGSQRNLLDAMQTREELYEVIGYHQAEQALDALLAKRSRS